MLRSTRAESASESEPEIKSRALSLHYGSPRALCPIALERPPVLARRHARPADERGAERLRVLVAGGGGHFEDRQTGVVHQRERGVATDVVDERAEREPLGGEP